ncbi:MAG: hypothetical protein OXG18_02360 [Gemmatimonadetes bacterium]|nr:hypothetical protein [Gemmatimonadota bacterium]
MRKLWLLAMSAIILVSVASAPEPTGAQQCLLIRSACYDDKGFPCCDENCVASGSGKKGYCHAAPK